MRRTCLATVTLALAAAAPAPARAQADALAGGDGMEVAHLLFVPAFSSAIRVDVGPQGRIFGRIGGPSADLPEQELRLGVGWLRYDDVYGRLSWGPYLATGLGGYVDGRDLPPMGHAALGMTVRDRLLDLDGWWFATLGAFAEAGVVGLLGDVPQRPAEAPVRGTGPRVAAGLEVGVGNLMMTRPFVFNEWVPYCGVEVMWIEGEQVRTVFGGLRIGFDLALREPDRGDPGAPPLPPAPGLAPAPPPPSPVDDL